MLIICEFCAEAIDFYRVYGKIYLVVSTCIDRVLKMKIYAKSIFTEEDHKMTLKPLSNRVVIKFAEAEEKTVSGIILTASAQEKPQIAEVVAVGAGKVEDGKLVPMTVKVGDKVIASKYAGTAVKMDGVEYTILSEDDILAIVD